MGIDHASRRVTSRSIHRAALDSIARTQSTGGSPHKPTATGSAGADEIRAEFVARLIAEMDARKAARAWQRSEGVFSRLDPLRASRLRELERLVSEYTDGDLADGSVIHDVLSDLVMLATRAGHDFDACLRYAMWQCGCEAINGGSPIDGPRDLLEQASQLARILDARGHLIGDDEIRDVAYELDRGNVLNLTARQRTVLSLAGPILGSTNEVKAHTEEDSDRAPAAESTRGARS